jgi:CRP/FNR family cyclic AMP-dependent transcriptional regulator
MKPVAKDAAQILETIALFREFTKDEMEAFIELTDPVAFSAGETIVRQDESGNCMYILIEGSARVVHRRGSREIELLTLHGGDFFGELALVDEEPRSADVIAVSDCVLFKASQGMLRALAGVYPTAAVKFFLAVARMVVARVRRTNAKYLDSLLLAEKDEG